MWPGWKSSASETIRRFWPEIIICGLLAAIVASVSYRVSGLSSPAVRDGIWFQADPVRVLGDMTDRFGNHYRIKVHPLFVLLTHPLVTLLRTLTGASALTAARLVTAFFAGVWVVLVFSLLRLLGCRQIDATIFAALGAVSAAALFWTGLTETYLLGSISILLALLAVQLPSSRKSFWITLASAFSLSVTITNWMAGLLATAVSFSWKRACVLVATAFCLVTILWGVQKFFYPQCPFFLSQSEEKAYINNPLSGGPVTSIKALVFHTMVMPRIRPFEDMKSKWRWCGYITIQNDRPGAGSSLATAAAALWALLLALGLWGFATASGHVKLRIVIGGTLLGQMALHSIYGEETFLYSLHFAPLLLAVAAMGIHTRLRPVVLALATCLVFIAGTNNFSQLSKAIELDRRIYESVHPPVLSPLP
ncbi:MAG: hypothetical protein QOH88_1915 [Verrucomicrobiota bacterium]|jgi:hypothetical protein